MSSFSWLDYAESDRRAAMDVIDLFREQDTRDELGIATVRDTFSDLLFPGTSAIQTRARYFLIVPWIYQRLERSKTESAAVAQKAKGEELALIDVLAASDDPDGTIGMRARKLLRRLPSMLYWQGLGRLGIRSFHGTRDQYHRSFDRYHARTGGSIRNDDGEVIEFGRVRNWDSGIPKPPEGFPRACSLALTRQEAEYLRERIMHAAPKSLFAYLIDAGEPAPAVDFPWQHPRASRFPEFVVPVVHHARNFSEAFHGASLLYNLMLAELAKNEEMIEAYRGDLAVWRDGIVARGNWLAEWNTGAFWDIVVAGNGRIPTPTRAFINGWLALLRADSRVDVATSVVARESIRERERALKRSLARMDGGRALELWGGAAGARQMDYRWKATARTMVQDVYDGLHRADA